MMKNPSDIGNTAYDKFTEFYRNELLPSAIDSMGEFTDKRDIDKAAYFVAGLSDVCVEFQEKLFKLRPRERE